MEQPAIASDDRIEFTDLFGGELWAFRGNDNRCAQARIAIEPFLREPIIGRLAKGQAHVLAKHDLCAMDAIAHGELELEMIKHFRFEVAEMRSRQSAARGLPIRPYRERGARRQAAHLVALGFDAADPDVIRPVFIEERYQRAGLWHRNMDIAIDCAW